MSQITTTTPDHLANVPQQAGAVHVDDLVRHPPARAPVNYFAARNARSETGAKTSVSVQIDGTQCADGPSSAKSTSLKIPS